MQSSSPLPDRRWARLAPCLRVFAEAGFFSVLYAAAAVVVGNHQPFLGPIEFSLLVGLGAIVGAFARDSPEMAAFGLIGAVLAGGLVGWLASPEARDLVSSNLIGAAGSHGIGWLGAFAVLRGSFIHGAASADGLEQLLRLLLPLAAFLWALATVLAPVVLWPSFAVYALWGSLAMIVAGLMAIGLVRLREVQGDLGEIHVRRMWRWLVIAAAIAVVPLSIPFVVLSGIPIGTIFAPIAEPVLIVIGLLVLPLGLLVEALIFWLTPLSPGLGAIFDQLALAIQRLDRSDQPYEPGEPSVAATVIGIVLATLVIIVLVIAIYSLARWVLRRNPYAEIGGGRAPDVVEHAIVVPVPDPPRSRPAGRQRRVTAHDAVTAYVTAVEELAGHPVFARAVIETPAEHSLRLRRADMPGSSDFSRLAADYQLARYAERPITAREDRRALSRLDRLRRLLRGA
ncbi:MAG: DUF4129 domain-containing protein [Chloroflexota bacterium]